MDAKVDAFIEDLLFGEGLEDDCDESEPQVEEDFKLPSWFDEKKFKRGQQHFKNNKFVLLEFIIAGAICAFAIPNIAKVMASTRRANTRVTSYRRYVSALLHIFSWLEEPLAPGTQVWKSLKMIRLRHFRASRVAQKRGYGKVGQSDIVLVQTGFLAFGILKAKQFGLVEECPGDEEAFAHTWRVICHLLGVKDRYNVCRENHEETKAICQKIVDTVFVPSLIEPPEYSFHITDNLINALGLVFPHLTTDMYCYFTKWLVGVPGYEYKDSDLVLMKSLLKDRNNHGVGNGVPKTKSPSKHEYKTLSKDPLDALKIEDYGKLETVAAYRILPMFEKWVLSFHDFLHRSVNTTYIGRIFLNKFTNFNLFLVEYFPIFAMYKFGVKMAYINIFIESIKDDTSPRTNAEVLKERKKAY